ncbi:hypothetical protein HPP92_024540 [Vanilla planifolia]|uniref:Uncharacterized protein n=1 Tax=Vanilla planifolia TaxID=51239 RepID=A0A835PM53_VANPL|nr:hypothetical protein HPP92_024540 [Vanilla planifolia]
MELNGGSYLHGTMEAIVHKASAPISCLSFVAVDIDGTTVASVACREPNPTLRILCAHPPGAIVDALRKGRSGGFLHRREVEFGLLFEVFAGVPEEKVQSSFPERRNCGVVASDAHHIGEFRPMATVGGRWEYKPRRLVEDVYWAIDGAERLVCIAGWSVNHKLVLGVVVRILIWDDETSLHSFKNPGLMRTHDEDAFAFFRHTKVNCRLSPRLHRHLPTPFTHHQKTIVDDAPTLLASFGPPNRHRQLPQLPRAARLSRRTATTPTPTSLFRTLNAPSHAHDFYQPSIPAARLPRGGPRQPWHDTHACVVGAAARDVLANFDQRWAKLSGAETPSSHPAYDDNAGGDWIVQIFRSIDAESAEGLPRKTEHSIYDAHVSAIRKAQRYIYIENQYFMGGCHLWEVDRWSGWPKSDSVGDRV